MMNLSNNIVIFASGGGSNAEQIIKYFDGHPTIKVAAVFCNNKQAGIIEKSKQLNIPCELISKAKLNSEEYMMDILDWYEADFVVLAGFLLQIPPYLIKFYCNHMINIHPSLLPKYGGKGMYGINVHNAVINANEKQSGITIHLVTEEYDKGRILFQTAIDIDTKDPYELASQLLILEHRHFSPVIEKYITEECS